MAARFDGHGVSRGSTLIELAIVVLIVSLLMGSLLPSLAIRHRLHEQRKAEEAILETKEALLGFAVAEGRLPWPDTDTPPDGRENRAPPTPPECRTCEGFLPWRTLGTAPADPWGRLYRYRVAHEFASPVRTGSPPGDNRLDLLDQGDVRINTRELPRVSAGAPGEVVLTGEAAAAVVSLGRNGAGGTRLDGTLVAAPPSASDEAVNTDGSNGATPDPHFYAGPPRERGAKPCSDAVGGAEACAFDDLVVWIPGAVVMNRLVAAERLP